MLANIFDPVQKCCANWTTHSNMYQHSPTSTNIRQQGEQTFPTCCANNVGAMLANMLRWFKPAFTLQYSLKKASQPKTSRKCCVFTNPYTRVPPVHYIYIYSVYILYI